MRGVRVGIQLPMPPPMQGSPVKPGNLLTAQEEPCGLAMATPTTRPGVPGVISGKFSVREIVTESPLVVRNDYI